MDNTGIGVELSRRFRLGLTLRPRIMGGARTSQSAGPSTEFRDHRDYQPGDDVRHLDWGAYARTDRLMIKRFFEESAPEVLVLIDRSASCQFDPKKDAMITGIAQGLVAVAQAEGSRVRELSFSEGLTLGIRGARVRPGMSVVVVSDLLMPEDPAVWLGLLGGCAGVGVVQVLGAGELVPEEGALRLTDVESHEVRDLMVDRRMIARYLDRLERLCEAVVEGCGRRGYCYGRVNMTGGEGILEVFEKVLVESRVVRVK